MILERVNPFNQFGIINPLGDTTMKTSHKTLIALAVGTLMTAGAQAAVYDSTAYGQPYVGAKAGKLDVKVDSISNKKVTNKDPMAYGIYGGYNFDPNFGVEAEFVGSGKADLTHDGAKGDVDAKTYGVYGTYRYGVPNTGIYAKGKLGVAKTKIDGSATGFKYTDDKTSLAGGVGVGFQPIPNVGIEAGYDWLNGNAKLMSIGANVKF